MHFHLPKPLHGWREFAGEVGIIVLGVLIALGAEQVIQSVHWRSEVKQTRTALDAELAHNLAAFDGRMSIEPCAQARLDELNAVLDRQVHGRVAFRHNFEGPLTVNLEFAVWDAATGEARSLIPLQAKLQYAELFDILRHYEAFRDREADDWGDLADIDFNTQLSAQEVKHAKVTINRLRRRDSLLPGWASFIQRSAEPLGIRPESGVDAPAKAMMDKNRATFCSRLI
jgi:hypothetical protein